MDTWGDGGEGPGGRWRTPGPIHCMVRAGSARPGAGGRACDPDFFPKHPRPDKAFSAHGAYLGRPRSTILRATGFPQRPGPC